MTAARRATLIGAGLVGALLATLLAQRGFTVEVFERRPDPRIHGFAGGRSINLSLVERGLAPLRMAGLADAVLAQTVTMLGRMVHARDGSTNLQRYGIDDSEVDHSVGRGDLNLMLLDAAARAGVQLHFDARLVAADLPAGAITLEDHAGTRRTHAAGLLFGCDGAGSALRAAMRAVAELGERVEPLGHGYKELEIPAIKPSLRSRGEVPEGRKGGHLAARSHAIPLPQPQPSPASGRGGTTQNRGKASPRFALDANALHIWSRGNCMCIALPNVAGNFTVTLFMPVAGTAPSFATLPDAAAARALFQRDFADLLQHMPTFDGDWAAHPLGQLATLYLERWHVGGRALLLGDAAHAVVPFHGQGMNAGFEDAAELATLLVAASNDPAGVFAEFNARRKPDADAIAQMSLANYVEMRDGVTDPRYLLRRELGAALTARAPTHFMSRYRMVSFTSIPYATCIARERAQAAFMDRLLGTRATLAGIDLDDAAAQARNTLQPLTDRT
ncbi:MAG TPA: NAD(P)/FAD-dependent oxidoreductase [Rhodanobacteraceae bacterium]